MNYGGDAADQVVKYSLDGIEHSLRLSGTLAKHLAVFFVAVLKDQKKSYGKTRMIRMVKENRPLKFFTVPEDQLREFAEEGKRHGLLYVIIKDKKNPGRCEVMVFADDAAKVNRIMDRMGLDFVNAESASVVHETKEEQTKQAGKPGQEQQKSGKKDAQEVGKNKGNSSLGNGESVPIALNDIQFDVSDEHDFQIIDEVADIGNFTQAREMEGKKENPKNLSEPSLHNSDSSTDLGKETKKPSVRKELEEIKQEQKTEQRKKAQQKKRSRKGNMNKQKKKARTAQKKSER